MSKPRKKSPGHGSTIDHILAAALALHQDGHCGQASALYRKILAAAPEHAGALHLLGLCALESGDADTAIDLMGRAVRSRDAYPEAHFDLGRAALIRGDSTLAVRSFERAASLDRHYAEPRHALGLYHLETGRPEAALDWLSQALVPDAPGVWLHRAYALRLLGRTGDAAAACARAVELDPGLAQARWELAELYLENGQPEAAGEQLEAASRLEPASARGAALCGRAALARGDVRAGEAHLRRCLELDPEDAYGAVAQLVGQGLLPTPERAPLAWVRRLYDGQAALWDQSAGGARGYNGPQLLAQALTLAGALDGHSGLTVLDAGCGSGLCAPLLRPLARRLDGVDLSLPMLELARRKNLYDRLEAGEITAYLEGCRDKYDLIAAAAVFIYQGELGPVLGAAAKALVPGGLLAFTCFPKPGDGYELTPSAYYRHGREHIASRAAGAGLAVVASLTGVHEYRDDAPVEGLALVLQKNAHPLSGMGDL
ncbi:tetratricopeptide repeat protein [Solidesulfovibrio sp.]